MMPACRESADCGIPGLHHLARFFASLQFSLSRSSESFSESIERRTKVRPHKRQPYSR